MGFIENGSEVGMTRDFDPLRRLLTLHWMMESRTAEQLFQAVSHVLETAWLELAQPLQRLLQDYRGTMMYIHDTSIAAWSFEEHASSSINLLIHLHLPSVRPFPFQGSYLSSFNLYPDPIHLNPFFPINNLSVHQPFSNQHLNTEPPCPVLSHPWRRSGQLKTLVRTKTYHPPILTKLINPKPPPQQILQFFLLKEISSRPISTDIQIWHIRIQESIGFDT